VALIYVLLVAHFVADFVCQTDWMAQNKSKRWDALALHVAVYGAAVLAVLAPLGLFGVIADPGTVGWVWLAVNLCAHFVQDAITSRINSRLWQAKEVHWFFVSIGFDQLLHYVTLFVTAGWWLR
jgi:hypothetical protein